MHVLESASDQRSQEGEDITAQDRMEDMNQLKEDKMRLRKLKLEARRISENDLTLLKTIFTLAQKWK